MLTSHNHKEKISVACTESCYSALNSGKGLLSCEERKLCIAVMQNTVSSKLAYQHLMDQVDIDKLIAEGYLTKRSVNASPKSVCMDSTTCSPTNN